VVVAELDEEWAVEELDVGVVELLEWGGARRCGGLEGGGSAADGSDGGKGGGVF